MWDQLFHLTMLPNYTEYVSTTWSSQTSARPTSTSVLALADLRLLRLIGSQWQKATMLVKVLTPHPPMIKN